MIGEGKILVCTKGEKAQMHHIDTTAPALITSMYMNTEHTCTENTVFYDTCNVHGVFGDLKEVDFTKRHNDESYSIPWSNHQALCGGNMIENGTVNIYAGTVIHHGPEVEQTGWRIVLYTVCVSTLSDVTDDDFESHVFGFTYAAVRFNDDDIVDDDEDAIVKMKRHNEMRIRSALDDTNGRWVKHVSGSLKKRYKALLKSAKPTKIKDVTKRNR